MSLQVTSGGASATTAFFNTVDDGSVQAFDVLEGEAYYVECYVQAKSDNAGLGAVQLVVQTNGTTISVLNTLTITSGNKGTWVLLSGSYTVPNSVTTASFGVRLAASATTSGDIFYVDDLLVRETTFVQSTWDSIVQGVSGTGATGATAGTVKTQITSVTGTASTAYSNAQGTIDGINQAVTGATGSGATAGTVLTNMTGVTSTARDNVQTGSNLLLDPGGERSIYWTGQTNVAQSSTEKRNGSYSVRVTSSGATARTLYFNTIDTGVVQAFAVRPAEMYFVQCYVQAKSDNAGLGTVDLVALTNGTTVTALPDSTAAVTFTSGTKGTWIKLSGNFTIPASTTSASFGLRLASSATTSGDVFYVDDMLVREVTAATSGYTVYTFNSNGTFTKTADMADIWVVLFGAGGNGSNGVQGPASYPAAGGTGGAAGAIIASQIDPASVDASTSITIGSPSSPTTSFGSVLSTSNAYASFVTTPWGLISTATAPTAGATGGGLNSSGVPLAGSTAATTTAGVAGGTGGSGGSNKVGGTGGSGGAGLLVGSLCQTGGAGGGGGGAADGVLTYKGGTGGAGGFPGGGGGGGGATVAVNASNIGVGGAGANGMALVIVKKFKTP